MREAVGRAVLVRGALVVDQRLEVGGILDLRPLVVAAPMAGEQLGAIDDADFVRVGEHRQHAPDVVVRHGVVVQVEADIGRLGLWRRSGSDPHTSRGVARRS